MKTRSFECKNCKHRWEEPSRKVNGKYGHEISCPSCGGNDKSKLDADGIPMPCTCDQDHTHAKGQAHCHPDHHHHLNKPHAHHHHEPHNHGSCCGHSGHPQHHAGTHVCACSSGKAHTRGGEGCCGRHK